MIIRFTGQELIGFERTMPATCSVRNHENGRRKPEEVVKTMGQTRPWGKAYQPAPFPPGRWEVTRVAWVEKDGDDGAYWPCFIDTDAWQELTVWDLDDRGRYLVPSDETIIGKGYGTHHARYLFRGAWTRSNTTLGCINVLSPEHAQWLGEEIHAAAGFRQKVYLDVPPWEEWL